MGGAQCPPCPGRLSHLALVRAAWWETAPRTQRAGGGFLAHHYIPPLTASYRPLPPRAPPTLRCRLRRAPPATAAAAPAGPSRRQLRPVRSPARAPAGARARGGGA